MKHKLLIIGLLVLAILGSTSGWVYHFMIYKNSSVLQQSEFMNLQVSFLKQYGTQATISEAISPKIYEVAWTDKEGTKNVSINVGGVWVLIASVPVQTTTPPIGGK